VKKIRTRGLIVAVWITSTLACTVLSNTTTDALTDQIKSHIEDQIRGALQFTGSEELFDKIGDAIEDFANGRWTRSDVPLPPDADVLGAYTKDNSIGQFVLFDTSMDVDQAESWMVETLSTNGWAQGSTEISVEGSRAINFAKGSERLALLMNGSESGGTTVSITVYATE
jgi:hypothetical protein